MYVSLHSLPKPSHEVASTGVLNRRRIPLTVGDPSLRSGDRNFSDVTFAKDDDMFYATAASGGTTWLIRGSIKEKSMASLRTDMTGAPTEFIRDASSAAVAR